MAVNSTINSSSNTHTDRHTHTHMYILSWSSRYEARENLGERVVSSQLRKLKESMAWLSLSVMDGDLIRLPPCWG